MDGSVPPILWYLLVVAFFIFMVWGLTRGSAKDHEVRMRELDILKMYAEKGMEPPSSLAEPLMRPGRDASRRAGRRWRRRGRRYEEHFAKFGSSVFFGGVMAGLAWWRIDVGGPQWAIYVTVIMAAVSAAGALGSLIAGVALVAAGVAEGFSDADCRLSKDDDQG